MQPLIAFTYKNIKKYINTEWLWGSSRENRNQIDHLQKMFEKL